MKMLIVAAACLIMCGGCTLGHTQALAPAGSSNPRSSPVASHKPESMSVKLGPGTIGFNGPVVGVNLYSVHNYSAAQTLADGERTLAYIKNNLHAGAVDIVWNVYTLGVHSNSVVTNADTLTAANVGILTQIALADHLQVEYRPLMFVLPKRTWEGTVDPTDPAQWFDSYYAVNLPYLRMAQRYHVSEYVIGTELVSLGGNKSWQSLLAESAQIYRGQITYAAHQSQYFAPRRPSPSTELVGMDMYESMKLASAPLAEVVAAYERFFAKVPAPLLRRTAIQETGIEARAGAYSDPPNLRATGMLDEAVQYDWFIAACETVQRFHMRAVFFWKVDLADYPLTHPASSLSTFEGKEGALAISKCAGIFHS